jgi:glucosamine 6-phosphate synthetase-like amidotransferase/phosphosugar isomerase protein
VGCTPSGASWSRRAASCSPDRERPGTRPWWPNTSSRSSRASPCEVQYASEFRYRNPIVEEGTVLVAISQSGETADTLAALEEARERGALTLGIVNVVGSSIARITDAGVYLRVGPEIGVASTKAFVGQVAVGA